MNNILIFFAIPVAVIIVSLALQKLLKNPFLVSAIIFSIFIIVAAITGDLNWLIGAVVYAILAFLSIVIGCVLCKICKEISCRECIVGSESDSMCPGNNNENNTAVEGISR